MEDYCCNCCVSKEEREIIAKQKEIKHKLAEQEKLQQAQYKLLLLGTADSGKSTFMKQLRLIHGKGYTEEERHCFARLIYQNIFEAMQALIRAMIELKIPYASPQNEIYALMIQNQYPEKVTQLQRHYVEAIRHLWADEGFQTCYKDGGQFKLDSTKYLIDNLDRIAADDYIPTCQDILRVRSSTTGIMEYTFSVQKIILRFIDVGGQKSERRKWIHCFENVTALIYVASLSEYDEVLMENSSQNRMRESLALFNTIIHCQWFAKSSIILFLNKTDILEEKIQFSDLITNFPEFEGKRQDVYNAMMFIRKLYEQKTHCQETNTSRDIHCQFICAMDTIKTRELFDYVKDIVLSKSLKEYRTL